MTKTSGGCDHTLLTTRKVENVGDIASDSNIEKLNSRINGNELDPYHTHLFATVASLVHDY